MAVREATIGTVELRRADPEVEEHAAHPPDPPPIELRSDGVEPSMDELMACPRRIGLRKSGRRGDEGVQVPVETENGDGRVGVEDGSGVASCADGGVDDDSGRDRGEELGDAITENGDMDEVGSRGEVGSRDEVG